MVRDKPKCTFANADAHSHSFDLLHFICFIAFALHFHIFYNIFDLLNTFHLFYIFSFDLDLIYISLRDNISFTFNNWFPVRYISPSQVHSQANFLFILWTHLKYSFDQYCPLHFNSWSFNNNPMFSNKFTNSFYNPPLHTHTHVPLSVFL